MSVVKEAPFFSILRWLVDFSGSLHLFMLTTSGTPITTPHGINIGTVSVLDTRTRESLSPEEHESLGWVAKQVMSYLEINREAMEGRRLQNLTKCLNQFVDGRSTLHDAQIHLNAFSGRDPKDSPSSRPRRRHVTADHANFDRNSGVATPPKNRSPAKFKSRAGRRRDVRNSSSHDSGVEEVTQSPRPTQDPYVSTEMQSHAGLFARAVNLLREAFELDEKSGVVFLGAGTGDLTHRTDLAPSLFSNPGTTHSTSGDSSDYDLSAQSPRRVSVSTSMDAGISNAVPRSQCPVSSTPQAPFDRWRLPVHNAVIGDVDREIMQEMFKRYPKGKLWMFNALGELATSEEESSSREDVEISQRLSKKTARKLTEEALFSRLFPGVRQVLFAPLWDTDVFQWSSACFCWSYSETRVFSKATRAWIFEWVLQNSHGGMPET